MLQAIIEVRTLTKFFIEPDGGRIEVIAPTDLAIDPGAIVVLGSGILRLQFIHAFHPIKLTPC